MEDCRELSEWRRGQCDTVCTGIRCYLIALSESGEEQQHVVINARNKPYHSNTGFLYYSRNILIFINNHENNQFLVRYYF